MRSVRAILNPTMSELLKGVWPKNMDGVEYIPLQKTKAERISSEDVIKRHDERVAREFSLWKRTAFILLVLCFLTGQSQGALTNRYDRLFKRYAILHGISPKWAKAVSIAESALDPNATSWVGAKGLMQFMQELGSGWPRVI